jgi:hypothetical protein
MLGTIAIPSGSGPRAEGLSGDLTASYATIFHRDEAKLRASHFQCNIASIVTEDLRDYLNAMLIRPVALNNRPRFSELEKITRDDSD